MATCKECQAEYLTGSLSCPECGSFVWSDTIGSNPDLAESASVRRIVFVIPNTDRRWILGVDKDVSIGRADPNNEIWPDIDLTGGKQVNGVSRQHAEVRHSEHGLVLVDLESTNGTVINQFPLVPLQPYLLQDGDQVEFGDLLVEIYLEN